MSVTPKTEDTESKYKNIKLINGNRLDILPTLETDSVDLVLTDLHINVQKDMSLKRHI